MRKGPRSVPDMRSGSDLDEEIRPHQVGADAVARRRVLREVLLVDLVHRRVVGEVLEEDLVERDVVVLIGSTRPSSSPTTGSLSLPLRLCQAPR